MEYLCTTCCKRKRRDEQPLPALERYLSRRIRFVWKESQRLNKPLLILSGKYGLLDPDGKIPWYDQTLRPALVDELAQKLVQQLRVRGVASVRFYALPRQTSGWRPYYEALEKACAPLGVSLRYKTLKNFL
jgi:hypothetical protein